MIIDMQFSKGSSSRSYLAVLLEAYTGSDVPAIKTALRDLLQHVLHHVSRPA